MPQPQGLSPEAYAADGSTEFEVGSRGKVGVLLIHGFTGSVAETRPMGEYLAARGLWVRCPLLPGHGTTPHDLARIRWQDWAGEVERVLRNLQGQVPTVFVGGLSLGALLTLWLGAEHPTVAGLIAMAPALKVRSRLMPLTLGMRYLMEFSPAGPMGDTDLGDPHARERIWCYDEVPLWGAAEVYLLQRRVRRALQRIRQPILIFQGRRDAQVPPEAAQAVYDGVASTDKTLRWLDQSGHNLLADGEREMAWQESYEWMMARVR